MKRIFVILLLVLCCNVVVAGPSAPDGLMTDLLEHTQRVYHNGYPTNLTVDQMKGAIESLQYPAIESRYPTFSWIVNDTRNCVLQTAYELQVDTSPLGFDKSKRGFLWRSGKVPGGNSSSVLYKGPPLKESTVYYWRVRTWNNGEMSPWSGIKMFKTAASLQDYGISRYPTVKETHWPVSAKQVTPQLTFYDFQKAAFGQLRVCIAATRPDETAIIRVGERVKDGRVDQNPAGSTRYAQYKISLIPGRHNYFIKTRIDKRNTSGDAFLMPNYIGEVMPFRYVEVETSLAHNASTCNIQRDAVFYPFNENASFFHCDNEILSQVWEMCRYSMKATGFMGVFIDGDRERIPYEGDSFLNQLSYYSVDREYSLARFTQDYLITHPTWPTEWVLQSVQMAWYDYLYTGDTRNIAKLYSELKSKSLEALAEPNGLISTKRGKLTAEVLKSVHFKAGQKMRDIVDWPHKGLAGNDNAESGETDGFVFCDFNVVVNSYHYFALQSMRHFAQILGKDKDVALYDERTALVRKSFHDVFFDKSRGIYRDGETTDHASLHGNMFPLAFGLVPKEHVATVTKFVKSRGMKCSVYGAQFLLDAVYEGGDGDYGLERMTATDRRGWYNMLRLGSTISLEAWDDCYKPNQDWNHAWGGAPANIIPRKLIGIEPLLPACAKVRIRPQCGKLNKVQSKVPTIRGYICLNCNRGANVCRYEIEIPANVVAELRLPKAKEVRINGKVQNVNETKLEGTESVFDNLGSGRWTIEVRI